MSIRPVYMPDKYEQEFVKSEDINFTWYPGFAVTQKQKSILSLHENIEKEFGINKILEISTKSLENLGIKASAFNLTLEWGGIKSTVESFYQGSKVFKHGGPYVDLYKKESIFSKKDERIRNSGELIEFSFFDESWGINDNFYSWLYLMALNQNKDISDKLIEYEAFTDIEFNPKKSFNCQAYSAALFVAAVNMHLDISNIRTSENFKQIFPKKKLKNFQKELF